MRVECDATTRKVGERHGRRAIAQFNVYASSQDDADMSRLSEMIITFLSALDTVPIEPCGWTGDVEDPVAWTCPACLAEHVTPEPDGEWGAEV